MTATARLACRFADRGFAVIPVPPADGKVPKFAPVPEGKAFFHLAGGGRIAMREAIPAWLYLVYPANHRHAGCVAGGFHQGVSGGENARRCYWGHGRFADAPIGVAVPPDILVIDVDAVDLWPAALLARIEAACSQIVRTPRNAEAGGHYWFPAPPAGAGLGVQGELHIDRENPGKSGENLAIGDLKPAVSGFVFAPGSRRKGGMYRQITDGVLEHDPAALAPLPPDTWPLLAEMRARSKSRALEAKRRKQAAAAKAAGPVRCRGARPSPNPDWRPRPAGAGRVTWAEAEAAAISAGWQKSGRGLAGPCALNGAGVDRNSIRRADRLPDDVVIICRGCAPPKGDLDPAGVRAHLAALVGRPLGKDAPRARPAREERQPAPEPRRAADLPDRLWKAAGTPEGTPGGRYVRLRARWPCCLPLPPSVRWIDAGAARREGMSPALPREAAGAIVYRFAAADDPDDTAAAVQLEAIAEHRFDGRQPSDFRRVLFGGGVKRPDAAGSNRDGGRRTFRANDCPGTPEAVVLVEGPIDALAFGGMLADRFFRLPPGRTAVLGAAGTPGFRTAAFPPGCGLRVIAPDADPAGRAAALSLARSFMRRGLPARILYPRSPHKEHSVSSPPSDWCEVSADVRQEYRRCPVCAGPLAESGCLVCPSYGTVEEHPDA